ncbi:unnamed protein product [Amoebophrya sp. A120]|nr:unnamed protein product [Amoebophrya sp. A120]|eukprot:GSA120T00006929001.1
MAAPAVAGVREDGRTGIPGQPCKVAAGATKLKECPRDCRGEFVLIQPDGCQDIHGNSVNTGQRVASHEYRITQTALRGGTDCPYTEGEVQTKTCPVDCVQTWVPEENARRARNDGQDVVTERLVEQAHPKPGSDGAPGADCLETITQRAEKCPTDCIGEWRRTAEACDPGAINWVEQIVSHRYAITRPAAAGYPNSTPGEKCKDADCANPIDCQENEGKMESCPRDCRGTWDYATDALLKEQCTGQGEELTRTFTIQTPKLLTGQECADKGKTATIVCPKDCVGAWDYDDEAALVAAKCTEQNAGQEVHRTFTISEEAENGGESCAHVKNARVFAYCPTDCIGAWDYNSTEDLLENRCTGRGETLARTFFVSQTEEHGGKTCLFAHNHTEANNTVTCPTDCVGAWNATVSGLCAGESDGTEKTRVYVQTVAAANNGTACPAAANATEAIICGSARRTSSSSTPSRLEQTGDSSKEDVDPGAPQKEDEAGMLGTSTERQLLGSSVTNVRKMPNPRELDLDLDVEPPLLCC